LTPARCAPGSGSSSSRVSASRAPCSALNINSAEMKLSADLVIHGVLFVLFTGWSRECLLEWDSFTSLAIPSMLMMCIEWWTYEIGSFLIGLLSVVELSVQSIIYEVSVVIPLGLGTAASVQVGNALGAGDYETAKRSSTTSLICTVFCVIVGAILASTKNVLGYIFTKDPEIADLVSWVMPIYIVFHLFEALTGACSGVLRGIGKQKFGAILNGVTYYGVGLPLSAVLLFAAKIGVIGTEPWAPHPQTPHGQNQLCFGLTTTLLPGSAPL
uniref:Solute carrier family 47 member 2 n=1 Tax=Malurus cyaneus samueli TaxID=2593467 RepID=A0A8C5T838_9PASS